MLARLMCLMRLPLTQHPLPLSVRVMTQLVFLDFGLMSTVDPTIMEAFARGIQACLAEDWYTLAKAFKETGFVNDPIQYKASPTAEWSVFGVDPSTGEDLGLPQLATELGQAMSETEGGTSRFGALATVLNQCLSPRWKMFTPPYVLLLIRTFLTLEGIAARVDPDFNIYEMAMVWRALPPHHRPTSVAPILVRLHGLAARSRGLFVARSHR